MDFKHKYSQDEIPEIFIICSAAEMNGYYHGKWCQAIDENVIRETVDKVVQTSPERSKFLGWHIYKNRNFRGLKFAKEEIEIPLIIEIAQFITEYGDLGEYLLKRVNMKLRQINILLDSFLGIEDLCDNFDELQSENNERENIEDFIINKCLMERLKLIHFPIEFKQQIARLSHILCP